MVRKNIDLLFKTFGNYNIYKKILLNFTVTTYSTIKYFFYYVLVILYHFIMYNCFTLSK